MKRITFTAKIEFDEQDSIMFGADIQADMCIEAMQAVMGWVAPFPKITKTSKIKTREVEDEKT
jgi:hypothetical protein